MRWSPATRLPVRTGRLVGRYWAPLLFWFVLGYLAHELALRGAAWLSHRNVWLGFAGLSVSVLITLTYTIMMLQVVRPGLGMSFLGEDQEAAGARTVSRDAGLVDNIAEAILPFLIFYSAWELFIDEVREWGVNSFNQDMTEGLAVLQAIATNELGLHILIPLGIALGSYLLRVVTEFFYKRGKRKLLGFVVALFEANWMFFAVISVSTVINQARGWLTSRAIWVQTQEAIAGWVDQITGVLPVVTFPQAAEAWTWLNEQTPTVMDGIALPLVWLTITAAVYGEEMDRDAKLVEGTRFERVGQNVERITQRKSADLFTAGIREKWTPLANGVRLVWQAGPLFYLTFCFLYVVLELLAQWAYLGVVRLIGPHPFDWWWARLGPIDFGVQALHEVVRIALLAAAFGIALHRARERRAERQPAPVSSRAPTAGSPYPQRPGPAGSRPPTSALGT